MKTLLPEFAIDGGYETLAPLMLMEALEPNELVANDPTMVFPPRRKKIATVPNINPYFLESILVS